MKIPSKLTYASPQDPLLKSAFIQSVELLTGRRKMEKMYDSVLNEVDQGKNFWQVALEHLQVTLEFEPEQLSKVPQLGPVIFIANHPFGVLDGLSICYLASQVRPDFRIFIHSALCREERIRPHLLPVDFDETEEAVRTNIESKRQALETLQNGGTIIIFPAGGISMSDGLIGEATDLEWKLFVTKLIQQSRATVVPVYFHGQNSWAFQWFSQISIALRASLIIHEVRKKMGETIQVRIGEPIPYAELAGIKKRKQLLQHLRTITYSLAVDETVQEEECFASKKPDILRNKPRRRRIRGGVTGSK